eukprot:3559209-Lingulodinium_polyedra.AAC.1
MVGVWPAHAARCRGKGQGPSDYARVDVRAAPRQPCQTRAFFAYQRPQPQRYYAQKHSFLRV